MQSGVASLEENKWKTSSRDTDRAPSEFNLARQSHAENVNRTQNDSRSGWFEHHPQCIPQTETLLDRLVGVPQ